MIYLITGANGAGKSLYAIKLIDGIIKINESGNALPYDEWIQQYEEDEAGYLQPIVDKPKPLIRSIFSNIPNLRFPSEHVYTLPDSGLYDWRDKSKYPYGSIFFDDEAHRRIHGTGKSGPYGDDIVDQLDMHRHYGHDFYFITQYPSKLHHVVRNLVSSHFHLQNVAGSANATLFTFPFPELNPNDYGARKTADKEVFKYPKKLYKYYSSSSFHSKRLRIPKKILFLGVLLFMLVAALVYQLATSSILPSSLADETLPVSVVDIPSVVAPAWAGASPPAQARSNVLSGCISVDLKCQCYDEDYYPLELDISQCLNYVNNPLPTRPVLKSN